MGFSTGKAKPNLGKKIALFIQPQGTPTRHGRNLSASVQRTGKAPAPATKDRMAKNLFVAIVNGILSSQKETI
jgi:hypothetical protein